jgi:pyrimidine-nucleoside phosphorylase
MAIYLNGMSPTEINNLTLSMAKSGEIVDLSSIKGIKVDKHSTGGIGDKVTMILMPLIAACGVPVAKMSGRGLGYTQGTIDKLESIPGFRTDLELEEFISNVNDIGISIMSQSADVALADKKLYALRDVSATVESIPLIASSVMSKKIAAGADKILLEVTCGSGSFMNSFERARVLGETMVNIGKKVGKETIAVITNMNQPLGRFCGNSLEVMEAIDALKGKGQDDLYEVCMVLGAYMLKLAGVGNNLKSNMQLLQTKLKSGEGLQKFKELVEAQGGDADVIVHPKTLNLASFKTAVKAQNSGYVYEIESKNIGQAIVNLGGGRFKKGDRIDHSVGIEIIKKIGDFVEEGEAILYIYSNDQEKAKSQIKFLQDSYTITSYEPDPVRQILDVVE